MYGQIFSNESDIYQYQIGMELSSFHQYLELTNNFWDRKIKEFETELNSLNERDMHYFDPEWYVLNSIPDLLKSSLLISIFSFFETEFDRVVKEFATKKSIPLQSADIPDKGIVRARKYVKKAFDIDLISSLQNEWGSLKDFQTIRNSLNHSGYITQKKATIEIIKKLKQYFDFSETDGEFRFSFKDMEYHKQIIGKIQFFLVELYKMLHSSINKH